MSRIGIETEISGCLGLEGMIGLGSAIKGYRVSFFFFKDLLFIYLFYLFLAASGLSCGMGDLR